MEQDLENISIVEQVPSKTADDNDDIEMQYSPSKAVASSVEESVAKKEISRHDAVINLVVPNSKLEYFAKWCEDIHDVVSSFSGFITRNVYKIDSDANYTEYIIILVFDTLEHFQQWQDSPERKNRVALFKKHKIQASAMNTYGGNVSSMKQMGEVETALSSEKSSTRIALQNSGIKIPQVLPPPKWKLASLLIMGVYAMLVVTIESGQGDVMAAGGLPKGFIVLINVSQIVCVLVYLLLPLMMSIPFVAKWLRQSRAPIEEMWPVQRILDQGFAMFAVKMKPPSVPVEIVRRLDKLEGNVSKLRAVNHKLNSQLNRLLGSSGVASEHDDEEKLSLLTGSKNADSSFNYVEAALLRQSTNGALNGQQRAITMAVKHYVKWECVLEFEQWTDRMDAAMSRCVVHRFTNKQTYTTLICFPHTVIWFCNIHVLIVHCLLMDLLDCLWVQVGWLSGNGQN
jgi:antibiotic biosynthesis monooxygenase (ABM) superfamily enzyme